MDVTSYLLGKKAGGGGGSYLQTKSVSVTSNGTTTINPDEGYDGLTKVNLTTNVQPDLESKSITITENGTTNVTPTTGKDGLSQVSITTNVPSGIVIEGSSLYTGGQLITAIEKFIGKIPNITTAYQLFRGATKLKEVKYDMTNITNCYSMFDSCTSLVNVELTNTTSVTTTSQLFNSCQKLVSAPLFDTSNVTGFYRMFYGCTSLVDVPIYDTSNTNNSNMTQMFTNCTNLSNTSLNNIMRMCINSNVQSPNKTLSYVGLTQAQAETCMTLSNYQDFINAGWTTGY